MSMKPVAGGTGIQGAAVPVGAERDAHAHGDVGGRGGQQGAARVRAQAGGGPARLPAPARDGDEALPGGDGDHV